MQQAGTENDLTPLADRGKEIRLLFAAIVQPDPFFGVGSRIGWVWILCVYPFMSQGRR